MLFKKINLSATFRRIGEELYKSYDRNYMNKNQNDNNSLGKTEQNTLPFFSLFLQSDQPSIRLVACLIILRTLSQADHIQNIFEILRVDLKDDSIKELFLYYYGTWTIIKWCKLSNKVI
jgi:hypothetical protein